MAKEDCVYLDESGINECLQRHSGRAFRGKKVYSAVSGHLFARESFIAAKCQSKIFATFCYTGTCHTILFNTWLEKILIPELKTGQLFIMDHATFHKSKKTKYLIEQAGCKILFLPSYSPDLNPIEVFWANFKQLVRLSLNKLSSLAKAIDYFFCQICT
ncbi:unnamed protein product [Candidatus Protochlamydia amoebophila UWE25]|uniref:Tc1-like transposase DDE domain-containing protein n=1 Tax=Protochlamydia amoebophila (strain UWE25) TaxID=264201 RepID=A0A2P9H9K7_PARUW|nr:unnamed protein product [Candidatus Protochlamydia amoebophila UWE25]